MKYQEIRSKNLLVGCLALFTSVVFSVVEGSVNSSQALVSAVNGSVEYSTTGTEWKAVRGNLLLSSGTTIRTKADSTVDLVLKDSGSVVRLVPDTTLRIEKLATEMAGEEAITETRLNLLAGSIAGSQRKLAAPSLFEITTPFGAATIRGTEYYVRADGAVTVVSGAVSVRYNALNQPSVQVSVSAGYSFNPVTGQVVPTTPAYLQNIVAHVDTVRENARVFHVPGANVIIKPEVAMSPTGARGTDVIRGNNGVGNGIDPQPHGNPPVNDGPGTGPGNPGNRRR